MGRWLFDSSVIDASGKGHDATLVGTTSYVAGNRGNALSCTSGLTGYATVADHTDLTPNSITICAWVKLRADNTIANEIVSRLTDAVGYSSYVLYIEAGTLRVGLGIGVGAAPPTVSYNYISGLTSGSWYHIAGTYDGTTLTTFLNGVASTPSVHGVGGNITYSTSYPLSFCSAIGAANYRSTDADIDDVQIYNTALTQEEIKRVMNGYTPLT